MSDPYERAKSGRLAFKDGSLATRKSIDKKKKKKKKQKQKTNNENDKSLPAVGVDGDANKSNEAGKIYSIDAAKNMNYDELFPVETKKFGYDPKSTAFETVEDALDDRVKKKADRYCK